MSPSKAIITSAKIGNIGPVAFHNDAPIMLSSWQKIGQAFKAGCDDHPVAHQVVTFRHDLALMYANAKAQPVSLGTQHILDGDGTAQRLHRAGKLHEEAVAGGLEEPALMRGDERFYNVGAQSPHARQGARLIRADHGRVADDIGRQDGGKTALLLAHAQCSVTKRA